MSNYIFRLPDLNAFSQEEALIFLRDADQIIIDEMYLQYNQAVFDINDFVIRRAFIKRWRFECIDYGYWVNECHERRIKKQNKINKKNN